MNKRPHTAEFIEATAFMCIVAIMCISWYYGYVKPNDQMRYQIMECTDGNRSYSAYEACRESLTPPDVK
jgi:hypothetical protein